MNNYSEYKDNGVEWIGEIPNNWKVKKLKHVSNIETGTTPSTSNESFYDNIGTLWIKPDNLSEFKPITSTNQRLTKYGVQNSRPLPPNSVLVCGIGSIGKFGFSENTVCTNQQINGVSFDKREVVDRYGLYLISSLKSEFQRVSEKVVVSILNKTRQENVEIPVPSPQEQVLISTYLDKRISQIDSLIEKIGRKIELLKEHRIALINQCVTKGLNPDVEMKDSGVEWIGEIPNHWGLKKLKWFFSIESGSSPKSIYDDGSFPVLGTGGVIGSTSIFMYKGPSLILGRKGTIDKPFLIKKPILDFRCCLLHKTTFKNRT